MRHRGTPLWQEYVDRGIIDDQRDWDKWFKCSDIDPTALSSAEVNLVRMRGYALLFCPPHFCCVPCRTYKLLRTFSRYMKKSDILKLLYSPFRRRSLSRKPDLSAMMLESGLKEPAWTHPQPVSRTLRSMGSLTGEQAGTRGR